MKFKRYMLFSLTLISKKKIHVAFTLLAVFHCVSCSQQTASTTIPVVIKKQDFVIKIPATGEFEAVKETTIGMPGSVRTPQVLEWLAEENTFVTKDQVVARFDGRKFIHQSSQEQYRIDKANIGITTTKNNLDNEKTEISSDAYLIKQEIAISEKFNINDLKVYSRNEIIDSLKNQDYLFAKQMYTDWRGDSHGIKSGSEIQLLSLKKMQLDTKLKTFQDALQTMEIVAPHDGLFVLKKNWKGDKARVGDTLFPGMKVASLPDLSELQAKVYVLESESAGIKVGQRTELILDAYPDQLITGEVKKIDAIAKTRSRGNPVKYFETIISIKTKKLDHWRPGSQLKATIFAAEKNQVISIPSQAMTVDESRYFVYLQDNNDWIQQEIKIGIRNTAQTEVLAGLNEGDIISLFNQHPLDNQNLNQSKSMVKK